MSEHVLKPVTPSAAIEAWYRKRLQGLIEQMAKSMLLHIKVAWNAADPDIGFASDESSTLLLQRAMRKWGERQVWKFERSARDIAQAFAERSGKDFDARFARILKNSGFTVRFKPTEGMVEAYRTVIAENVNLIRSIPQKFLTDVQTSVWQSVMKGYDMAELSKAIKHNYGVTWRRAALISRDQSAKAKAIMEEARRSELGIEEALWVHSGAGKEPRPEHLKWGRQKARYKIRQGMWSEVDQAYVWPGTAINCRCSSRSIFRD